MKKKIILGIGLLCVGLSTLLIVANQAESFVVKKKTLFIEIKT